MILVRKKNQTWSPLQAVVALSLSPFSPCSALLRLCLTPPPPSLSALPLLHVPQSLHLPPPPPPFRDFVPGGLIKPTSISSLHSYKAFTPAPFHSNPTHTFQVSPAEQPINLYLFRRPSNLLIYLSLASLTERRGIRKIQQWSSCAPYFLRIQSSAFRRKHKPPAAAAVAGFRALLKAEPAA